nr:hypothetical protein GCM10020185_67140 [Pseudomonas brassicacearum subsp. brassicacearum]
MGGGITLGGQASDCLEDPMKMKGTQARALCQFIQARQFLGRLDLPAGGGNPCRLLGGDLGLVPSHALAGPVTGGLGLFRRVEELDVARVGQARQAAWVAIDAGGFHAIDEGAVGAWIPGEHGGPARIQFRGEIVRSAVHGRYVHWPVFAYNSEPFQWRHSGSCG